MASRKIPIKIRVTSQTTVRRQVRVQHQARSQLTTRASYGAWAGPVVPDVTNHYGDVNTISGEGHQVAIGVVGSVTQIGGPAPVDPEKLAIAVRGLLEVLDQFDLSDQVLANLREDAAEVLDEAAATQPDQEVLRSRGRAMLDILGKIGIGVAGGSIARVMVDSIQGAFG